MHVKVKRFGIVQNSLLYGTHNVSLLVLATVLYTLHSKIKNSSEAILIVAKIVD